MKKLLFILMFFVYGIIQLYAQTNVLISGYVSNNQGGVAIANHTVYFHSVSDSLVNGNVSTDTNGYYSIFILLPFTISTNYPIVVSTIDCQNYSNEKLFWNSANYSDTIINFGICEGPPPISCFAYFYYSQDSTIITPNNQYWFQNLSSTNYLNANVSYLWNFGDGTSSTLQNPTHQFQYNATNPFIYNVCLIITVMDNANTIVCQNTYCNGVTVSNPNGCNSYYAIANQGYIYSFTGHTNSNHPTVYSWDFGDGTIATGQNTTHTFYQPSNVCLTTLTTYPGGDSCETVYCHEINPNQFIQGTALTGNNPLDSGFVILFGIDSNSVIAIDTVKIDTNGHYKFLLNPVNSTQQYYLKSYLTTSSIYFNTYFPTYYDNTTVWLNALPVIANTNTTGYIIHLVSLPVNPITGGGSIGGNVAQGGSKTTNVISVEGAQVMLFDMDNHPLKLQYSDNNGNYNFTGLPDGTYRINVEIPGKTSVTATISLSSGNQSISNIDFVINGNSIVLAVNDQISVFYYISEVYPNPSAGELFIDFSLRQAGKFDVNIYNQSGQLVYKKSASYSAGKEKLQLNVRYLSKGLYTLKIVSESGYQINRKLVILK